MGEWEKSGSQEDGILQYSEKRMEPNPGKTAKNAFLRRAECVRMGQKGVFRRLWLVAGERVFGAPVREVFERFRTSG
jgi:hypothetical protein